MCAARLHEDAGTGRAAADRGRQGARRRRLQQAAFAPARRDRQRQAREIGWRAPKPGGGVLGIDMEASGQGLALEVMRGGGVRLACRQGLEEAAAVHAGGRQHELARQPVEAAFRMTSIDQPLQHHRAAAGIAERLAGRPGDAHRRRIGGRRAVQDLDQVRQRRADGIAREARHRRAGAMAEQQARRDGLCARRRAAPTTAASR